MEFDIKKQVMEQKLIQQLLERMPEDQKENAMAMIDEITGNVQKQVASFIPGLQAIPPSQLEKILRDQVK
jgi:hypothetical protein